VTVRALVQVFRAVDEVKNVAVEMPSRSGSPE